MKKILATIWLAVLCQLAFAQAGNLDSSFGNFGIVRTDLGIAYPTGNDCYSTFTRPDGSFYLVIRVQRQVIVSRRLADGAPDLAYGEGGYSVPVYVSGGAAVMQADGKIVIGGAPSYGGFPADFTLARLNANGFPDTSFSGDGNVKTDFFGRSDVVSGLAVQADGKIIAVGSTNNGVSGIIAVARYNADGSLDNSFSGDGLVITPVSYASYATDVAVQANGSIVVTGYINSGTNYYLAILRYLPDGSLDNSFSDDGIVSINQGWWLAGAHAVSIQADGKIVAGGYVNLVYAGAGRFLLVRVNSDGSLDNSFSNDGILISNGSPAGHEVVQDIAIQPDGKIVAAGSSYIPGNQEFTVARYNANGTPDNSFSGDGIDVPQVRSDNAAVQGTSAYSLALLPDGRIMVAGTANYSTFAALRYLSNGTPDNSLDGDGILKSKKEYGKTNYRGLAIQPDGKLVLAAATGIDTRQPQFAVTRYNINGTLDPSFAGDGKLIVDFGTASAEAVAVAIQPDGKILVAGNVSLDNNADFAVVRLHPDGSFDNSFSGDGKVLTDIRGYNDGVTGIALRPDGKIVVGGFSNLWGTDNDLAVVQYLPDGTPDPGFSGDGKQTTDLGTATDMANAIALQQDGKIILAGKKGYTAQVDHSLMALVRYNLDGSPDASFDADGIVLTEALPGENNEAHALAIDANGNIVVAGRARYSLAVLRYTPNGLPDYNFSGDGKQLFSAENYTGSSSLVLQPDGKMVAGGTSYQSGHTDFALVRLNTDGSPDNNFSGDGRVQFNLSDGGDDFLFALGLHGNRIYAAGSTPFGGVSGCVAAVLTGGVTCNVTASIPDSYTLASGVDANTVYIGYTPAADLTLTVQPSGTAPYTYAWSNGAATQAVTVMPIAATTYSVTVTDALGCKKTVSKLVNVVDVRCGNKQDKVIICRVPPGNPANYSTQCVNGNAVAAHLGNGSYLGNCKPGSFTVAGVVPLTTTRENSSALKAYPNPSASTFRLMLTSNNDGVVSIIVRDVVGRVVERRSGQANQMIITGNDYRPGIYFVEVIQGNQKFQVKLVKQ